MKYDSVLCIQYARTVAWYCSRERCLVRSGKSNVFYGNKCVSAWKVVVASTDAHTSTVEKENVALGVPCLVSPHVFVTVNNAQRNKPLYYFPFVLLAESTHFEVIARRRLSTIVIVHTLFLSKGFVWSFSSCRVTIKVNNRLGYGISAKIKDHWQKYKKYIGRFE